MLLAKPAAPGYSLPSRDNVHGTLSCPSPECWSARVGVTKSHRWAAWMSQLGAPHRPAWPSSSPNVAVTRTWRASQQEQTTGLTTLRGLRTVGEEGAAHSEEMAEHPTCQGAQHDMQGDGAGPGHCSRPDAGCSLQRHPPPLEVCVGQTAGGKRAAVGQALAGASPVGGRYLHLASMPSPRHACSQGTSPLGSAKRLRSFHTPRPPLCLSSGSNHRGRVPLGTA